jgi:hypothetical protein
MGDKNIVDKITDDSSKIVITTKSVKWIIGILSFGVIGIFGFAWGLYVTVDGKVDTKYNELNNNITTTRNDIIYKIDELDKEKVKPNHDKNYKQDLDIVRLYERTNSREVRINRTTDRPMTLDTANLPSFNQ